MTKRILIAAIILLISLPTSTAFAHPGHSDLVSDQGNSILHYLVAPQHGGFALTVGLLFAAWMCKSIFLRGIRQGANRDA